MFKLCFISLAALACAAWLFSIVRDDQGHASPVTSVFQCNNGQTISEVLACDGSVDCADGSDEEACAPEDAPLQSSAATSSESKSTHTHAFTAPAVTAPGHCQRSSQRLIRAILVYGSISVVLLLLIVWLYVENCEDS